MDRFEEQEMKKTRTIIRKWFDRLSNKITMEKKPKAIRDKLKDNIIRDIGTPFYTKKKKERVRSLVVK